MCVRIRTAPRSLCREMRAFVIWHAGDSHHMVTTLLVERAKFIKNTVISVVANAINKSALRGVSQCAMAAARRRGLYFDLEPP